jgi:hypothetical protein
MEIGLARYCLSLNFFVNMVGEMQIETHKGGKRGKTCPLHHGTDYF